MNITTDKIYDFLENKTVSFTGAIASILALILFLVQQTFGPPIQLYQAIIYVSILVFALAWGVYSYRVRSTNIMLGEVLIKFHEINHMYRDFIVQVFQNSLPMTDPSFTSFIFLKQREILQAVCERIATCYTLLIRRQCVVTLKLITRIDHRYYAETFVRSEANSHRDTEHPRLFEINTGINIALDEALRITPGRPTHFYSADLVKDYKIHKFDTQRRYWDKYYKSAIVVPVRYTYPDRVGQANATDDTGLLIVDTKSRNRLNDHIHVHILCAFADQIYVFMKLMQNRFIFPNTATRQSQRRTS